MFHWDLGSVPEWFGGVSLLLAFAVFANDRRNQARAQVDLVAVWYEEPGWTTDTEPAITVTIVARNASLLPVKINSISYKLWTTWNDPRKPADTFQRGPVIWMLAPGQLPPGADWRHLVEHDLIGPAPRVGPLRVTCMIQDVSVTDNAGRTWAVTGKGRARRLRGRFLHVMRQGESAMDAMEDRAVARRFEREPPGEQ
jgi:hypothetical protein